MDAINSMDYDYIASGHYANVVHPSADQIDKPSILELSKDMVLAQIIHFSTDGCLESVLLDFYKARCVQLCCHWFIYMCVCVYFAYWGPIWQ